MTLHTSFLFIGLLVVLLLPAQTGAAVLNVGPSDCSVSAVNAVISAASDGDSVQLTCTGTVTWNSTVNIPSSKGITLSVLNGSNTPKGSANFPLTVIGGNGVTIINATIGTNRSVTRITGFKFQNSGTPDPFIKIGGQGVGKSPGIGGFRFDNNYLDTVSGQRVLAIWSDQGPLYGVIDNNTFHNNYRANDIAYGPYNIQIWNYWHPAGNNQCWGCDGWTNAFNYGDQNFVFIEDNLFEHTANAPGHMRHYISSELGGRYVSRHNTFVNNFPDTNADLHDAHGLCIVGSNGAGARGGAIYANTITGTGYDRAMQLRGGQWLVYDNTIVPGAGNVIEFDEYRAEPGGCDPTNNLAPIQPPWPIPPAACSGCATAGWNSNDPWVPLVTDGSHYPLPQQIFATYVWNNLNGSTLINPKVSTAGALEATYIQNNRDYFASSTRPAALSSYTPYTYPHPLRNAGPAVAPSSPTNVRVN